LKAGIIGGGFTGAALAFQLARRALPGLDITVYEPRPMLGAGLAYGTDDPAHRLNARAQRMSMLPENATHFCDWIRDTEACRDDDAAVLEDGRIFPRRAIYRRYVADQLAPLLASGAVRHVTTTVTTLTQDGDGWRIGLADGTAEAADIVVLATGHAPPAAPARLASVFGAHDKFIADPTVPDVTRKIAAQDRVLIVGTGLTMADIVASLHLRGHAGPITAISRRGQSPRGHAAAERPMFGDFEMRPARSALELLAQVRATLLAAKHAETNWQSVFDALRCQAQPVWRQLPEPEKRRVLRHLRPFWDVHRHRLPPQVAAALARRVSTGGLTIRAASIAGAALTDGKMDVSLRPRGTRRAVAETFDAIFVTTGPGPADGKDLIARLIAAGTISADPMGQGLECNRHSQALTSQGAAHRRLLIAGPPARAYFGELMSVPEIAVQVEEIAGYIEGIGKPG
jgi:uncharacterized NAD(P)/FAD-binding protein YdhS